jgi:hypothetical protein
MSRICANQQQSIVARNIIMNLGIMIYHGIPQIPKKPVREKKNNLKNLLLRSKKNNLENFLQILNDTKCFEWHSHFFVKSSETCHQL